MNIYDFAWFVVFYGLLVLVWRGLGVVAKDAEIPRLTLLGLIILIFKIFG